MWDGFKHQKGKVVKLWLVFAMLYIVQLAVKVIVATEAHSFDRDWVKHNCPEKSNCAKTHGRL